MAVLWVVAIALMMETASISETSVNFCQTTRPNNPEGSELHMKFGLMGDFCKISS
jgi:hypothetical protein